MSERAFSNWHNAHNGYGEFGDLDAASLEDARRFFDEYYSPRNAVLAIVGDVEAEPAFALAERHFGAIGGAPPPPPPDIGEPLPGRERAFTKTDPLAARPALAFAYHTPPRESPQFLAMGLLHQLLAAGDDSLLHRELVSRRGYGGELGAGINFLGSMYAARTPLLWTCSLIHDAAASPEAIVGAAEETIAPLREAPPDEEAFARALVKARSSLYAAAGGGAYPAIGRADLLAAFALFDDDPARLNRIEAETRAVTPATGAGDGARVPASGAPHGARGRAGSGRRVNGRGARPAAGSRPRSGCRSGCASRSRTACAPRSSPGGRRRGRSCTWPYAPEG